MNNPAPTNNKEDQMAKKSKAKKQKATPAASKAEAGEMLVNFVLDETGSMEVVRDATISGFNEYVNSMMKGAKGPIKFTLTKFDSRHTDIICNAVDIKDVPMLSRDTYTPGDMTPLYDAIASTVIATDEKLKAMPKKPTVLCVIMTDGEENASKQYTREKIFELIKAREAEGWRFVYLGANQDAWSVGQALGLAKGNVVTYDQSKTVKTFAMVGMASVRYASHVGAGGQSANYGNFFTDKDEEGVK